MRTTRTLAQAALCLAATLVIGAGASAASPATPAAAAPQSDAKKPIYQVDANWPKPLPNKWIIGQVGGVAVDQHDNVWVYHRPRSLTVDEAGAVQVPKRSICCVPAPPVLEFDRDGNLLKAWGGEGQGYDWPLSEHGIWVDQEDHVWLGGNAATDRQLLKFDTNGKFLMQIGHPSSDPLDSLRTDILGQPASITVDGSANEVYIADGYGNKRVIVYDTKTGKFKRLWGAYGNKPNDADPGPYDPAGPIDQQFRNPVHCVRIAKDGLVYVCDRVNDRIQVFTKAGQFVKEFFVATDTLGNGSTWDIGFSNDAEQKFLVVIDGENNVVWTLNRDKGTLVNKQFRNGRNAGQFHWVHQFATDSQGNIYTGEVDTSKRMQKFNLQH